MIGLDFIDVFTTFKGHNFKKKWLNKTYFITHIKSYYSLEVVFNNLPEND